jgi:hypothetical protein
MAQSSDISPQGNWHWNAPAKRLLIDVQRGADLSELSGDWSIDALEQMLEGLSRGRLDRAFEGGDGPVRCNLRLSSGRSVHLVGAFVAGPGAGFPAHRIAAQRPGGRLRSAGPLG